MKAFLFVFPFKTFPTKIIFTSIVTLMTISNITIAQPGLSFDVFSPNRSKIVKPVKHGYVFLSEIGLLCYQPFVEGDWVGTKYLEEIWAGSYFNDHLKNVFEQGNDVYFWHQNELIIFSQISQRINRFKLSKFPDNFAYSLKLQTIDPVTGYVYLNSTGENEYCLVFDWIESKVIKKIENAWVIATPEYNYKLDRKSGLKIIDKKTFKVLDLDVTGTEELNKLAQSDDVNLYYIDRLWDAASNTLICTYKEKTYQFKFDLLQISHFVLEGKEFNEMMITSSGIDINGTIGFCNYDHDILMNYDFNNHAKTKIEKIVPYFEGTQCKLNQLMNPVYDHYRERWILNALIKGCYEEILPTLEVNREEYAKKINAKNLVNVKTNPINTRDSEIGLRRMDDMIGTKLDTIDYTRTSISEDCIVANGIFSNEELGLVYLFYDNGIIVYDKVSQSKRMAISFPKGGDYWRVYQLTNELFAFTDDHSRIFVYDIISMSCLRAFSVDSENDIECHAQKGILSVLNGETGRYFWLNLLTGDVLKQGQVKNSPGIVYSALSNSLQYYYFTGLKDSLYKYDINNNRYVFKVMPFRKTLEYLSLSPNDQFLYGIRSQNLITLSTTDGSTIRETMPDLFQTCQNTRVFKIHNFYTGYIHTIDGYKIFQEEHPWEMMPKVIESGLRSIENQGISSDGKYWYFSVKNTGRLELYEYNVNTNVLSAGYAVEGDGAPSLAGYYNNDIFYDRVTELEARIEIELEEQRKEAIRLRNEYIDWLRDYREKERQAEELAKLEKLKKAEEEEAKIIYHDGLAVFEAKSEFNQRIVVRAQVKYVNVKIKDPLFNRYDFVPDIKTYELLSYHLSDLPRREVSCNSGDGVEDCEVDRGDTSWSSECVFISGTVYRILPGTIKIY